PGNFKQYMRLRDERYEREVKEWESQREYIEKQEEYIRRVHYGQLAKQAQSRQKALDRLERVERPAKIEAPQMQFGGVVRTGEIVHQPVAELSGGERSRACLAKLVAMGVNVLVLDEPTNHLDVWACAALEDALLEYEGTAIVVSHDRYFLNRVVDLLIVLDNG